MPISICLPVSWPSWASSSASRRPPDAPGVAVATSTSTSAVPAPVASAASSETIDAETKPQATGGAAAARPLASTRAVEAATFPPVATAPARVANANAAPVRDTAAQVRTDAALAPASAAAAPHVSEVRVRVEEAPVLVHAVPLDTSDGVASHSGSSRGRSSSRHGDRRAVDVTVANASPAAVSSSSADSPPKAKYVESFGGKQDGGKRDVAGTGKEDSSSNDRLAATASHDGQKGGHPHHGYNHHLHNRHPFHHGARAPSSSPTPHGAPAATKTVTISDKVTTSSPRVGHGTPTRSAGGNGNHHTFSPVVNPVLEKMREAQRESHRAYLKSNSDYNRAEMKYVSIEAELRLAEFWLEIETKNLEDVGKRIEVHDWNFQKIIGQGDNDVV
ncbi:unnamed protein product [Phytophthora lilii]|uniref:Unnamed protein product n=1 Tax=Phytophthora lilii TaxID=2077276 RepID=A0A9W6TME9_9STRA|nr:unnamed protein product [Phytophthora lilii]